MLVRPRTLDLPLPVDLANGPPSRSLHSGSIMRLVRKNRCQNLDGEGEALSHRGSIMRLVHMMHYAPCAYEALCDLSYDGLADPLVSRADGKGDAEAGGVRPPPSHELTIISAWLT